MQNPTPFWPRGILAGALLAAFLIIPVFVVMLFDSAAGTSRGFPEANGRFALFQRPVQMRAGRSFFDGKLGVQAVLSQRFAMLPAPAATKPASGQPRAFDGPPPDLARSTMLRLRLENESAENLEVGIVRVDSSLGDFNGQPTRVMLAPHQTVSIDSSVREQKLTASSLPVSVALRVDGSIETHQLLLTERYFSQAGN